MSADITRASYSSSFYYPEIVYNELVTIASGQELIINHNLGYIPITRIWGELFPGEFSSVWTTSAQYFFSDDYFSAGIYGYIIYITDTTISIYNDNREQKRVYVRLYNRE